MKNRILCLAFGILFTPQLSHADDPVKRVHRGHNLLEDGSLVLGDEAIIGETCEAAADAGSGGLAADGIIAGGLDMDR